MKNCPNCNAQLNDNDMFCGNCGTSFTSNQAAPNAAGAQYAGAAQAAPTYTQAQPTYVADLNDHTAEFDAQDISDNKVYAMLPYLMGAIGIIIALLASHDSEYVKFHLRQSIKILVTTTLLGIASAVLVWTFIVPIVASIMLVVLQVIQIICFFQVCKGQAKEPAIVRDLSFLK